MSEALRHVLPPLAVTLAVVSGPLVAMVYRFTQPPGAATGSFSLAQVLRGALCAVLFLSLFAARRLPLLTYRLVRPLLFLAACAALTAPVRPHPYENLVFAVKMVFLILIFANVFHLAESRHFGARGLALWAWALLLILVVSTGAGLATGRVWAAYGSRYATGGFIGQPMEASSLLLSALPVFICLLAQHPSAVAGLLLLFATLFFTMCRNALIAAGGATGCALLIGLRTRDARVQRRAALMFLGILVLLAGLGFGTRAGTDLLKRFKDLHPVRGTGSGRYAIWEAAVNHIRERPLPTQVLGEGVGSIRKAMGERYGRATGSHNDWLDLINSFGLFGLVGIAWWYGELARLAWRLRTRRDGSFQGACAVTVMLALISVGTGGFFEPCWALSYAALGFWAGGAVHPPVCPAANGAGELYA